MKSILLFLLGVLCYNNTAAQTFSYNSINYNITDAINFKVEVGSNSSAIGNINIPNTVIFNGDNYTVTSIGNSSFYNCSGLTSINIANTVTNIQPNAFYLCTNLTSITIPNSVITIGQFCFSQCSSLPSIVLPNSLTSIETFTFQSCVSLTSITIPSSVTNINNYAFTSCFNLNTIYCYISTPLTINSTVFNFLNQGLCTLYVPFSSLAAYEAAAIWTNFNPILPIFPLPSKLLSFSARLQDNNSYLNWNTIQEINSSKFIIERSSDAINWVSIDSVDAQGNSDIEHNYTFIDLNITKDNYYRLKILDIDNKFEYSQVQKVTLFNRNAISFFPNPAMNYISILNPSKYRINRIAIYNSLGQYIETSNDFSNPINIEKLIKGEYYLQISTIKQTFTYKFMKE